MTRAAPIAEPLALSRKRRPWWALSSGYLAFTWAVFFALANIYLQLGLPDPLQGGARHHFSGGITVLNLAVVPIKLVAALVALALVRPWGERLPRHLRRLVLIAAWGACAILVGYPVIGSLLTVGVQSGILTAPPTGFKVGGGFQTRVLLYGTFFLVAGILFGIAAWDYQRTTSSVRP